ncbi:MAG: M14 family zinc carboxypeptidase, partial [Planctomycetota bacterium]
MLSLLWPLLLCSFQSSPAAAPASPSVPASPAEHLGRPLGRDFELADWQETSSYYRRLAEESPRVLTEKVGTSTEGRDFLLTTISSEANLARLDEWKRIAARLADPRGLSADEQAQLVKDGRVIVFISCAMHATETAAPQWGMEFAHALATSDAEPFRSAREEVICLIAPSLNPDGQDIVVNWYRETVGTPYEASGLLELYQRYAGHDNNRDWFALTQQETRIVTELLYDTWHP